MDSEVHDWGARISSNISTVIYEKAEIVASLLAALLCGGHVLLEDVPGVGKTILARALAASLDCDMKRIQCTPDLMPADVTGVSVYNQRTAEFEFREGPVATNILLVDEINRASPRTQSALLEAMEDRAVTVDGRPKPLPDPFFVIATENPLEFEGTFPLPAAQKDRFFLATTMGYPSARAEREIMESHRRVTHPVEDLRPVADIPSLFAARKRVASVAVPEPVERFILEVIAETRRDPALELGASPRASRALFRAARARAALDGRTAATREDVVSLAPMVLWKRIRPSAQSLLRGVDERRIVDAIVSRTTEAADEARA